MKTLNSIQTLSKVAKTISRIIFVFAIVGACLCAAGIISFAANIDGMKLGGVTFKGLLQDTGSVSEGTLYASIAQGIVYCIGTIILAKFSELYFRHELEAGTPFTFDGAKEMLRLGILTVCISFGEDIIASIVYSILAKRLADVSPASQTDAAASITIGIAFIVISLLCKHGAELSGEKTEE